MHSEWVLQASCTILLLDPLPLTVPPQIKKILLASCIIESLWFFSYFFLLSLLVLLSSTDYITTAFVITSKHLRLEIKIQYYRTLHSTVK